MAFVGQVGGEVAEVTSMEVVEYTDDLRGVWDDFVEKANNGTLFALQSFFDYHPPDRFRHRHLLFYKGGRLVALLPAAEVEREGELFLVSHPGASFDGFLVRVRGGVREAFDLVDAAADYAKKAGFGGLEVTLPPWVYYRFPEDHVDFALFARGARYRKRELTAVLPLKGSFEENLALFRPTARTAMRKALRAGVEVRESEDFEAFYRILEENLSLRHGVSPTHTLDELQRLAELLPGRIRLFAAFLGEEMIAGTVLFVCNPRALLAFYISQDYSHQSLRPLNLLFARVVEWGIGEGFSWLDFGTYTLMGVPNFGLARFKESLGAKGIFRKTIVLPLR